MSLQLEILTWAAKLSTVAYFASSWPTCQRIKINQDTGKTPLFPFLSMIVNCLLWAAYGWLKDDNNILIVNVIGGCFGLHYTFVFCQNTSDKLHSRNLCLAALAVVSVVGLYMTMVDPELRAPQLGLVCSACSVVLFGSPLVTVRDVIASRSTASMDFRLCAMATVVSSLWALYGAVVHDPFVLVPNMLGSILGAVQVLLFFVFPKGKPGHNVLVA